jgi:5-methyltetrahydrofolate--homocysteine methyltransferase
MADFEALGNAVISCDVARVKELSQRLLDEGAGAADIINLGLISGMSVVGDRFKKGDMYVPEVLMAAKAMNDGMFIVKPFLVEGEMAEAGKVLIATVAGDLHDIGKNLVGMMMESGGLTVIDMGVDLSPEKIAAAVREHQPDVVGLSALLTTTMLAMKDTIEVLVEEGLRDKVKIIVGGAPVTADFAREIGADGWAPDAASAKDLVLEMTGKK